MSARLLKDPNTVNCRIFIGHLQTDDLSKMELEQHFAKYGPVIGAVMNRGFGFVQFENERSAQLAIQNEDGQMFRGRRIDVKPAKKDTNSRNNQRNSSFNSNNQNQSFNQNKNQNFNNSAQSTGSLTSQQNYNTNSSFQESMQVDGNEQKEPENNEKFDHNPFIISQDKDTNESCNKQQNNQQDNQQQHNEQNDNRNDNNQFDNDQSKPDELNCNNTINNSENSCDHFANNCGENEDHNSGGIQNQFDNGQSRNQSGNNQSQNRNNQGGHQRSRASRGSGKNKNKNRDNSAGSNFRDRSPLNRGNRGGNDDKLREWDMGKMRPGNFGPRDSYDPRFDDRFKDMMPNYRPMAPTDYSPVVEKNDCEIIVVHKSLTEYAEAIEARMKKLGLTVDLLFPNEDVLLSRVLGNIANRGCLYAVVVTPVNLEHHSLTLNILHGLPQEHRNMPVEDALGLISRDFSSYKSGGRGVPLNTPFTSDRHPDAIQVLLNMLADNHQLTASQYERVQKYLDMKREEQVQVEAGDAKDLPASTSVNDPKQAELQSRILNILNSNKPAAATVPAPSPVPAPTPVPPTTWAVTPITANVTATSGVTPSPLLNDPTVQKALDSLLQGNLLKSIGDSQSSASSAQPLFAAFPNINRL